MAEYQGEGFNQLRFDDTTGQISAQLQSSHGISQLNLGKLSHPKNQAESEERGEGFELRTDAYGAVRAGKGMLITTYAQENAIADHLEADDITYIIQKQIKNEFNNPIIIIITNDNDYLQMYDKNTIIINMQFKDLSLRIMNDPKVELEFKIIYGDKSDNIPKIQQGLNKENAFKLAMMDDIDKNKYLIPFDISLAHFASIIRKRLKLTMMMRKRRIQGKCVF